MKNKNNQTQELTKVLKIGRESYTVDIDGNVHSQTLGELGHMEDIVETAKWFTDLFDLMFEIEDGLTDASSDLS